jgi:plasmid stabilization system protein ParE
MAAVFTERALGQLATLISQIARSSPKNARSALGRIERAVLLLDRNPKLGTQRPDLSDVTRLFGRGSCRPSCWYTAKAIGTASRS